MELAHFQAVSQRLPLFVCLYPLIKATLQWKSSINQVNRGGYIPVIT